MDREFIEQRLLKIQEKTRKLIDDAYVCGYKDGYLECTCHKGLAMNEGAKIIYQDPSISTVSLKHMGGA